MGGVIYMKEKIIAFVKKETVLVVAAILAVISAFFVHPDQAYIDYIDFRVLGILLSLMIIMAGVQNNGIFDGIGRRLLAHTKNTAQLAFVLVFLCFFSSMVITNDVALLTFVPFALLTLQKCGQERLMVPVIVLQTIAANLGSMLTPIGNPQNLYLYGKFQIPDLEFISTMFLPFLYSIILITITCLIFVKSTPMKLSQVNSEKLDGKKTALMMGLLIISILIVFHGIPYYIGLLAVIGVLCFADRKALLEVDYLLLFTFCAFFVFAGNMARIPEVRDFFGYLVQQNTFLYGILTCQFISNVPSALLLSNFVTDYKDLLYAVNIGGIGTLISSLASLITFREYVKHEPKKGLRYLGLFTVVNVSFLGILIVLVMFAT